MTAVVAVLWTEWRLAAVFAVVCILVFSAGRLFLKAAGSGEDAQGSWLSLTTVAACWAVVSLAGALPFWLAAILGETSLVDFKHFSNASFEGMSGFTSTGLSVVSDPSKIPRRPIP